MLVPASGNGRKNRDEMLRVTRRSTFVPRLTKLKWFLKWFASPSAFYPRFVQLIAACKQTGGLTQGL